MKLSPPPRSKPSRRYEADPPPVKPPKRPFLWKVQPPKANVAPSYFFGTVHHPYSPEEALGTRGLRKLDSARVVYTETITGLDDEADQQAYHETYEKLTPGEKRSNRGRFVKLIAMQAGRSDVKAEEPVLDVAIMERRRSKGTALRGLETLGALVHRAADLALSLGIKPKQLELLMTITGGIDLQPDLTPILGAYETGHVHEVRRTIAAAVQEVIGPLLHRHRDWLPVIRREVCRGNAFIAAGVGHWVADGSVIELLRARGFRIERLR